MSCYFCARVATAVQRQTFAERMNERAVTGVLRRRRLPRSKALPLPAERRGMREDAPPRDDARSRFTTLPISSQGENKGAPRGTPGRRVQRPDRHPGAGGDPGGETRPRAAADTAARRGHRSRPSCACAGSSARQRNAERRAQKPVRSVSPPPCSPPSHKHDAAIGPMLSRITE